jgi:hypothetical protein
MLYFDIVMPTLSMFFNAVLFDIVMPQAKTPRSGQTLTSAATADFKTRPFAIAYFHLTSL